MTQPPPLFRRQPDASPLIGAHRGAHGGERPENTAAAFRRAIELECDLVELDVRRTADGELLVFHDAAIGGRTVAAMTAAEARGAAARHGIDIPTLDEALGICAGRIVVDIEIKDTVAAAAAAATAARLLPPGSFLLSSFSLRALRIVRRMFPALPRGWIVGRAVPGGWRMLAGLATGPLAGLAGCPACLILDHRLAVAGSAGGRDAPALPWLAWTVNDPAEAGRLADLGAWVLITDVPDTLLAWRRERRGAGR
ncbi:MAG TPA: glycerophosphodiester phosphodiesterase [Acidobacteriota bacterium]|nr:glycerophosphodiester phosphodiesterase [Acidobacteriota bacterium]HQM63611.1 glycerophosphodiester phosphodiesterase [Acidobacteriota bacterium]